MLLNSTTSRFGNLVLCFRAPFEDVALFPAFLDVLSGLALFAFSLSSMVVVNRGSSAWCALIMQKFPECSDANDQRFLETEHISTDGFAGDLGLATFGTVGAFVASAGFLLMSGFKFYKYYKSWELTSSMARLRQGLRRVRSYGATSPSNEQSNQNILEE